MTKTLVICGDSGQFTDEQGRKAARLRAYDKMTGREVGTVFLDQAQTGSPMTFMLGGRQHIVVASGGFEGGEFICYRLPAPRAAGRSAARRSAARLRSRTDRRRRPPRGGRGLSSSGPPPDEAFLECTGSGPLYSRRGRGNPCADAHRD